MKNWTALGLDAMPALAKEISALIKTETPILVEAEMGSGKTTFAKHIVAALGGNPDEVSSPTFSIIQSYDLPNNRVFHHVDLYRIEDPEEFLDLDLDSYIDENSYLYIEWPRMFKEYNELPCSALEIRKNKLTRDFSFKW